MTPDGAEAVRPTGSWRIRIAAFGPSADLKIDGTKILISKALLPSGSRYDLTLDFRHERPGASVRAIWAFDDGPAVKGQWVLLDDILGGYPLRTTLRDKTLSRLFRAVLDPNAAVPHRAALILHRDLQIVISSKPLSIGLMANRLKADGLLISPAPSNVPYWRSSVLGLTTGVQVPLGSSGGVEIALRIGDHARLSVEGPKFSLVMRGDVGLLAAGHGMPTTSLPMDVVNVSGDEHDLVFALRPRGGAWNLPTPSGMLGVNGDDYEEDVPSPPLRGRMTIQSGHVREFCLPLRADHHNLRVAGADWSRLDLHGIGFEIALQGASGPKSAGLVIGKTSAPLALNLDCAVLRVARGRDLLGLQFRFRGLNLRFRDARPYLEPRQGAEPSDALLIVDFPPQHIMERAFLRQNVALPDVDPALSPADIRGLRLPGASKRRQELSKAKLETAAKDGDTSFPAFAEAWQKLPAIGEPEKPWLGPDGLLSVKARQAARALAAKLQNESLDLAIASLGTTPIGQAAIDDAVALIPLPPLPIAEPDLILIAASHKGAPQAIVAAVMDLAARRSNDYAELAAAWRAQKGASPTPFFLPKWPLTPADWKRVADKDADGIVQLAVGNEDARLFLQSRLQNTLDSTAQDAIPDDPSVTPEGFSVPVEARLASPSRLSFEVGTQSILVDADHLTRWEDFDLRVVRRASRLWKDRKHGRLEGDMGLILRAQGISESPSKLDAKAQNDEIEKRLREIKDGCIAPDRSTTALELPARLILSPAQDARFHTPGRDVFPKGWEGPHDRPQFLWHARLVEALPNTPSVRAVWSPDFEQRVFANPPKPPPLPGPWTPWDLSETDGVRRRFRTSLDASDRHELVILSSVPGLPVIGIPASKKDNSQVAPPPGFVLEGLEQQTALYVPRALPVRRLLLGSLGASLEVDARFEPPVAARRNKEVDPARQLFETLSVERWQTSIVDGYDVETTILRRGYMFPHGHRAALVKVTEPRLRPISFKDPGAGYVVEEAQRIYVEVTSDPKAYPAPGQPNAGREWQPRSIRMVTTRTPDLIDPTEEAPRDTGDWKGGLLTSLRGNVQGSILVDPAPPAGAPPQTRPLTGLVFWPRTKRGTAGTVPFKMSIDGSDPPVSLPLLFVDNKAVNDPKTLEAICLRYYAQDSDADGGRPPEHSLLRHGGAKRSYAEENASGDCSMLTDWHLIGAHGRNAPEPFDFDGALQGAAQPPFYPRIREAQVRSQQIQGLTGADAAPVRVAYAAGYVATGFKSAPKGAPQPDAETETYLSVVADTTSRLDMKDSGNRSGGVGRPALDLAGFNRRLGPIGATTKDDPKRTHAKLLTTPSSPQAWPDLGKPPSDFAKNFFSPDAKLLGLISLRDIVALVTDGRGEDALPILQEIDEFRLDDDVLVTVQKVLLAGVAEIREKLTSARVERSVLPELWAALDDLEHDLQLIKPHQSPAAQAEVLTRIWTAGQRLLRALKAIAKEPLGPFAEGLRQALTQFGVDIDAKLAAFDPFAKVRSELANALKSVASEPLISTIIRTPALAPELFDSIDAVVKVALQEADTWSSGDPAAAILAKVEADPQVQSALAKAAVVLTADAFRGPLYDELQGAFEGLAELAGATFAKSASVLLDVLIKVGQTASRFQKLKKKADAVCGAGLSAFSDLVQASIPDLGVCPTDASTPPVDEPAGGLLCRWLIDTAKDVRIRAQKMHVAAGPDLNAGPYIDFAESLATLFETTAKDLGTALDAAADAKASLVNAASPPMTCGAVSSDIPKALSRTRAALSQLRALAASILKPRKAAPSSEPPTSIATDWQAVTKLYVATAARCLRLLQAASLAGATGGDRASNLAACIALLEGEAKLPDVTLDTDALATLKSDAETLNDEIDDFADSAASTMADVVVAAGQLADSAAALQKTAAEVDAALTRWTVRAAFAKVMPDILAQLQSKAKDVAQGALATFYVELVSARQKIIDKAGDIDPIAATFFGDPPPDIGCKPGWSHALLLLKDPVSGECRPDLDALTAEKTQAADAAQFDALLAKWQAKQSAPLLIAEQVQNFAKHAAHAALVRLLDVDSIRQTFVDQLQQIVPFRKKLTNTLNLPLRPLDLGIVHFSPTDAKPCLKLSTNIEIDLLPPKVTETFEGSIPAFDLDVTGVITVKFKGGVKYSGGSGQRGELHAPLTDKDVKFGPILTFLEQLGSALSIGGGGNGPFVRLGLIKPEIEAGYKLAIDEITLGITFTNINFSGSILLPFGNEVALIRFALGSLQSPFMISAGIYGGSGYFGLEASADGIESFEASFEFGGVAALAFGPLAGVAYVTTGVYVQETQKRCALSGIFSAGFSAHIAFFAICATLTLRIGQDGDSGNMVGEATFTFSFKVGFLHYDYEVTAKRSIGKGFDNADKSATSGQRSVEFLVADLDETATEIVQFCSDEPASHARLVTTGVSAEDNWGRHRQYFDASLIPDFMKEFQ